MYLGLDRPGKICKLEGSYQFKKQRSPRGGPNQTKPFTAAESSIYDLIGMKESEEGLESCKTFGVSDSALGSQIIIDQNKSERIHHKYGTANMFYQKT